VDDLELYLYGSLWIIQNHIFVDNSES